MKNKKENPLVIKDNSLIQVSKMAMNLNEMKAFSFIIAHIPDFNNKKLDTVRFNKAEFRRALGLESQGNNVHIKSTLKKMLQRVIEIQTNETWTAFQVLSKATVEETGDYIDVKINESMKPYLYELKERFTEYKLSTVLTLKSKHAFRLYEWLKSFHLKEVVGYIGKIKELLGIKYKNPFDIIRYCIDPAVEEINDKTDLFVSYEKVKTGRVVSAIKFFVKEKEQIEEKQNEQVILEEYKITHIKSDGEPETFEITGQAEVQRLIDENGFEKGRTFIYKAVGDKSENAVNEFTFNN